VQTLRLIGYWRSDSEPHWPDPRDFVDDTWDADERAMVGAYLSSGAGITRSSFGLSTCRFCGEPNGSAEYCDDVYIWPEGLAHYIQAHGVRLPRHIVDHIRGGSGRSRRQELVDASSVTFDRRSWRRAKLGET
jgi:hypothetical protein